MNKEGKKEFIEKNTGKDKIIGRPIRLNKATLIPNHSGYAELLFYGDIHIGHPQCELKKATKMLDYCLKHKIYIIIMGDLLESGTRDSVGDTLFKQDLNPQEQMEKAIELLEPIAKAGLVIGLHAGNHENRITKVTGIDISKIMAKILNVKYLGYSCWNLLNVGKMRYSMYSTHGASGAKYKHTKLKSVMDLAAWIDADIIAQGHVHSIASEVIIKQSVDFRNRVVNETKTYVVLTGSYISYDDTYAQMKNMPPAKTGSPKAKIFTDKKDVHFSL